MGEAAMTEAPARRGRGTRRDGAAKPLGVPYIVRGIPTYSDAEINGAKAAIGDKTELDVLIAYLQGMGTALKQTR